MNIDTKHRLFQSINPTHSPFGMSTSMAGLLQSKANRTLTSFLTTELSQYELSLPEWITLGTTYEQPDLRPSELAESLGVTRPVVTNVLNSLEKKDLIKRELSADDSRVFVVKITQSGKTTTAIVEKVLVKKMRSFLGDITLPEMEAYASVITKLSRKQ